MWKHVFAGTAPARIIVIAAMGLVLAACGSSSNDTPASTPSPSATVSSEPAEAPDEGTGAGAPKLRQGYLPLWPFADGSAVFAWQARYRGDGSQPWHLAAGATALTFARTFLDYTEVDRVTSQDVKGQDALIGVGWLNPNREPVTVGVVHLIRFGTGSLAPWEVVGTKDSRLTLATPSYGAELASPVRAGGRITGVDESLHVVVRSSPAGRLLGEAPRLPAGGNNAPWSTSVAFTAPAGTLLTIAVSTGGHLAEVEAFAITGVRASRGSVATCRLDWGTGPLSGGQMSEAPLVNVRTGQHPCYDRIVFDIAGETSGYRVRYVDRVTTEGAGSVLPVSGAARLQVTVLSPTHDPVKLITHYIPDDPMHVVPVAGYRSFRQVVWAGSFEGQTSFGLGLRTKLPFNAFLMRGQNGRTMVVVDVAHES